MTVTIQTQIKCVQREIWMREQVYPNRVDRGKMAQKKADEELAAMRAVLETLKEVELKDRLL